MIKKIIEHIIAIPFMISVLDVAGCFILFGIPLPYMLLWGSTELGYIPVLLGGTLIHGAAFWLFLSADEFDLDVDTLIGSAALQMISVSLIVVGYYSYLDGVLFTR